MGWCVYVPAHNLIMKQMNDKQVYCIGRQCSVKNQCIRYTHKANARNECETPYRVISKCTNQKLYVQDKDNIVKNR